jgi:hypothetical protein
MANPHMSGRRRELKERGVPLDTMITTDTYGLLLTEDSLTSIANDVSGLIKRKLTTGDVDQIAKFCARLREGQYYRLTFRQAQKQIAKDFVARKRVQASTLTEENDDYLISGVAEDTDRGTIADYERKELMQFTPDESQYKFTAHANRRGNSVIDEERVAGERSSPDNILPVAGVTPPVLNKEMYKMAKAVQSFIAPDSVEKMFTRVQTSNINYYNINLPHQIIQFDSRNRLPQTNNGNPSNYRWNLHTAGKPGQIGDIRIQDTLQQLVQMKLFPFWAPINPSVINPYNKIRMLILEYAAQSTQVHEFNDPSMSIPTTEQYHFELEVQKIQGDRMYLVPRENGEFHFRKPVAKNFDTFTTHFRTPFLNEVFDADSGVFIITYGNPTLFTITSPMSFNLNTGDLIYVYNSHSGNSAIDNEINRQSGQIITKLSNTQFTIAVDTSSIAPGSESGINVYFGSKRLFFQIEFTCLDQ